MQLQIERARDPVAAAARQMDAGQAMARALSGGDDYQLLFTLAAEHWPALQQAFPDVVCIGCVGEGQGVVLLDEAGQRLTTEIGGYRHF